MGSKLLSKLTLVFTFSFVPAFASADFFDEPSGKAFLGFGLGSIDVTPIVLGADYRFVFDSVDFFEQNDLKLLAGVLFWSASDGPVDYSVFEISSGLEKSINMGQFIINVGGRLGIANTKVSIPSLNPFFSVSNSETNLFIAPHGEFLYPLNEQMAVGGEMRIPLYFADGFDFFDVIYVLGSFNYIF